EAAVRRGDHQGPHRERAARRCRRRDGSSLRRGRAARRAREDGVDLLPPAAHGRRLLTGGQAHRHDGARRAARTAAGIEAAGGPRRGGLLRGSGPSAAMRWSWPLFVLALLAAPALAWGVYRLAKELGFLDPPWNPEHEERRTIIASLYALLLFL